MVAMAVLTILIIAFSALFGWNITSIFDSGQRTKAIAEAEKKLERLYYSMDNYDSDPEYVSRESVFDYQNRERNFCVEEETNGYNVTVVVFYHNGERHVAIPAFILGEGT